VSIWYGVRGTHGKVYPSKGKSAGARGYFGKMSVPYLPARNSKNSKNSFLKRTLMNCDFIEDIINLTTYLAHKELNSGEE
jgi:hypothetical protein